MKDFHDSPLARAYRCRDCGREVGFRSRPRTLTERYILPLLLVQPVRCAECFQAGLSVDLHSCGASAYRPSNTLARSTGALLKKGRDLVTMKHIPMAATKRR